LQDIKRGGAEFSNKLKMKDWRKTERIKDFSAIKAFK
jgi:hypothetical protein